MQLVSLTISRDARILRKISFKSGLNLILDKPLAAGTESGNNIGKTTVLRLIDYCIGSDGDEIWQDTEFKKINQDVYEFLHSTPSVYIELVISNSVRGIHTLRRSFKRPGQRKQLGLFSIDDVAFDTITAYRDRVKDILFGTTASKPSLRQLAPKFVRSSSQQMSKTLKILGDYGSSVDYEALHLFLFGFFNVEVLEERAALSVKNREIARDLLAARRTRKEGEIKQLLIHLRREVEEAQKAMVLHGEVPEISATANKVSEIRTRASVVGSELGRIEGEIASLNSAIAELQNDYENIDSLAIRSIYSEAGKYHEKLQHDWEELTDFVNSLHVRKQRFLKQQLSDLTNKAESWKSELSNLQAQEERLVSTLLQTRAFEVALEERADLHEKLKQIGGLETSLKTIEDLQHHQEAIVERLESTRMVIEDQKSELTHRVALFNTFFTTLSKELYGEEYLLTFDDKQGSIVFSLTAVGDNVGAGKKASQTAAFDISYIKFLHEARINFPTFVCHDGIESIHSNQLRKLLTTANKMEGQLILAAIRDKLPGISDTFITENTVLELSQNDKLFRV